MARKTPEEKLAELQATREKVNQKIAAEKAKLAATKRKEENRRKVVVGAVVLAHAKEHPSFHAELWRILDQHTTRENDREFLGLEKRTSSAEPKRRSVTKNLPVSSPH